MLVSRTGEFAHVGVSLHPERSYAVVVHGAAVLPVEPTRADLDGTIASAVRTAIDESPDGPFAVTVDLAPMLLDAITRADSALPRVAVIRVVPRPATDPALARSPAALIERRVARRFTVAGGHDLLGNELCPLDQGRLEEVCAELAAGSIRHVAIVAAGSQARPGHEREVADAIQTAMPGARISAASEYGGHGLVAREATVVLDCALSGVAEQLVDRCERVLSRLPGEFQLRVARGDGGYTTASRIRTMPVVAFGATDALEVCGAAYLEGLADCRVLLTRDGTQVAGEVRHGLAQVSLAESAGIGTELVVPTAVLTPERDVTPSGVPGRMPDVPVVRARHAPELLACVGAAVSSPTSWLDEVAFIESADELRSVRRDAEERATAFVTANGAAPGTAFFAEVSTVAVPYSPAGTVRIRVRVAGRPDIGLAEPLMEAP